MLKFMYRCRFVAKSCRLKHSAFSLPGPSFQVRAVLDSQGTKQLVEASDKVTSAKVVN